MKIAHFSTSDHGGAAKACIRLHYGLLERGFSSNIIFKETLSNIPFSANLRKNYYLIKKIKSHLLENLANFNSSFEFISQRKYIKRIRPNGLEHYSFLNSDYDFTISQKYKEADILNFHWVSDFLNWETFFQNNKKPIIWTLHDQNPFLGGEHYIQNFNGLDGNGYPLPRKYSNEEIIFENKLIKRKIKLLSKVKNLHIVCPSLWMFNSSKNSELFNRFPHYHIPNGFPCEIFKPLNKNICKQFFGISVETNVILFLSEKIKNFRKGYSFLQKAINQIDENKLKNTKLCVIGDNKDLFNEKYIIYLGSIFDERLMAIAYSMADVFILPSLEDNLPNTMVESILCGTPVIAFDVCGISDIIKDGENGILCSDISVNSLKNSIERFLNNITQFDNYEIAVSAKNKFQSYVQTESYINLYESIYSSSFK
jgi:glycosyltransferase involved in cell wall biosynthesis